MRFKNLIKVTHRYRLDKDNFTVRRNEIDATFGTRGTYFQIGYLKLNRNIGPAIEDLSDREEVRVAGRARIARYWSIFGSAIVDLTSIREDPLSTGDGFDPIRHRIGIAYDDDCLSMGVTWRRDYQPTGDARRGNSFLFRLAFPPFLECKTIWLFSGEARLLICGSAEHGYSLQQIELILGV